MGMIGRANLPLNKLLWGELRLLSLHARTIVAKSGIFLIATNIYESMIRGRQKERAPKGKSKAPWGLHIRSFWKIHFINPPEVQGQVVFESKTMRLRWLEFRQKLRPCQGQSFYPSSSGDRASSGT